MSFPNEFLSNDHIYHGFYRCIVEQNGYDKDANGDSKVEDPEKRSRVQVRILGLHSFDSKDKLKIKYLPWAEICFPLLLGGFGKDKTGIYSIPQINSWCYCFLLNGNSNLPVIIGSFLGQNDLKDFDIKSQYTTKIVTRSKAVIEVNDNINDDVDKLATEIKITTKGEQEVIISDEKDKERIELKTKDDFHLLLNNKDKLIELKTSDGHGITIDDDNKEIKIIDANDNSVTFDDNGIIVEDKSSNKIEMTSSGMKLTDKNSNVIEMSSSKVVINSNFEIDQ